MVGILERDCFQRITEQLLKNKIYLSLRISTYLLTPVPSFMGSLDFQIMVTVLLGGLIEVSVDI